MIETLRELIDQELAKENDVEKLKSLVIELAELADKKGATEAQMKELFHISLDKDKKRKT